MMGLLDKAKKIAQKSKNNPESSFQVSYSDIIQPEKIKKADKKPPEINPEDFFKACAYGNLVLVKDFIQKSDKLSTLVNDKNQSGLLLACKNGHYEIARVLIKAKSDLNLCDNQKHTPIHYAILNGHHKILNLLIKYNAIVDDFDSTGNYTPIMLAIKKRDYFAIHYLLNIVNLNIKNRKRQDIFDFVITEKNISANTKYIFSSHHKTRDEYAKRKQIYSILLSKSKDISRMTTREMRSFLLNNNLEKQDVYHFVFHKRHEQMLYNIITQTTFVRDLKIVPTGYDHEYPFLLLSVKENLVLVVKALLEKGVDINYPLQQFNDKKILRLFSNDEVGKTPLMIAYNEGYMDMVDLLLEYNADVHKKDLNNWTVIDMAKAKNDKTMIRKFKLFAS